MTIELAHIARSVGPTPNERPTISAGEYERRLERLSAAAGADWVVVYGDREHLGNLSYLCGLGPRFEEAVLVLGHDRRALIVGTEGMGYAGVVPLDVEILWMPSFSLMGIDRTGGLTLDAAFRQLGLRAGQSMGVVGWKSLGATEWSGDLPAIVAPSFLVDCLRTIAGDGRLVRDVTPVLMNATDGQRLKHSADQIAYFEHSAAQTAASTFGIISACRVGRSESDLAGAMTYRGQPLSYHQIITSGPDTVIGIKSPGDRVLELGDPIFATVGMWGGNCGRGGMVAAGPEDLRPDARDYLERVAIPYWRTIVAWYESVRVGASGGAIHERLTTIAAENGFQPILGVGHLMDWEDWPNTVFRRGSTDLVRSGLIMACDIFSAANGATQMVHCEDTVAIADADLRAAIAASHPALWARMEARQRFMRDDLGIALPDDILPLMDSAGYLSPFWLSPDLAFRVARP